jgi:hypothetical protein
MLDAGCWILKLKFEMQNLMSNSGSNRPAQGKLRAVKQFYKDPTKKH